MTDTDKDYWHSRCRNCVHYSPAIYFSKNSMRYEEDVYGTCKLNSPDEYNVNEVGEEYTCPYHESPQVL